MTCRVEQSCNFSNHVTRTTLLSTHPLLHIETRNLHHPQTTSKRHSHACDAGSGNASKCEALGKDDSLRHRYTVDWRRQQMLGMHIPCKVRFCRTITTNNANYKGIRRIKDDQCFDRDSTVGMGGRCGYHSYIPNSKLVLRARRKSSTAQPTALGPDTNHEQEKAS